VQDFLFPLRSCLPRQHQPTLCIRVRPTLEEQDRRRRYRRTSNDDDELAYATFGSVFLNSIGLEYYSVSSKLGLFVCLYMVLTDDESKTVYLLLREICQICG